MFCFPSPHISCDGGLVSQAKKRKNWTLEVLWVPEKVRLLSDKSWLQSQLENVVFPFMTASLFQESIEFVFQFSFAY